MTEAPEDKRALLRHALATLAYRGGKSLQDAPPNFGSFVVGGDTTGRTPAQILSHMSDVLDWGHSMAIGAQAWNAGTPGAWDDEVARFQGSLARLDERIATPEPLGLPEERLFQGPIADCIQHVGQLAMMRRLAGAPVPAENFAAADI